MSNIKNQEQDVSYLLKLGHELKNPIHGINGLSEFLVENWDLIDEKEKKEYLSTILNASNKLVGLIGEFFDDSIEKKEIKYDLNLLNITEVSKSILESFQRLNKIIIQKNNVVLEITLGTEDFYCQIDLFWYEQLISNLLSNAVNYSKNCKITINMFSKHGRVYVAIHDEGIGIPKSELEKIFTPFYRSSLTKDNSNMPGTGIGLANCREIVKSHGGKIYASKNDKAKSGTIMEFYIPKVET